MYAIRLSIKIQIIAVVLLLVNLSSVNSQVDSALYRITIQNFQKAIPGFQKLAFKKFRKLYSEETIKKKDFKKYLVYIVPSFKVDLRKQPDQKNLINCVDFKKIWSSYECYFFKDNIYFGVLIYQYPKLFYPDLKSNFSSVCNQKLAIQLKEFNPDMAFYPDVSTILCALKNGQLYYIDMLETLDYKFIPEKDFIFNNASSFNKLNPIPVLKHYKKLK